MRTALERSRGFSLLELLIIVAIVLIVVTIAIPSLLASRQRANEGAAVANLHTISNAEATYLSSTGGYYGNLSNLIAEHLLDERFEAGPLSGYNYSIDANPFAFTATATPVAPTAGRYEYYLLPDGVIRYSTTATLAPLGKVGSSVN